MPQVCFCMCYLVYCHNGAGTFAGLNPLHVVNKLPHIDYLKLIRFQQSSYIRNMHTIKLLTIIIIIIIIIMIFFLTTMKNICDCLLRLRFVRVLPLSSSVACRSLCGQVPPALNTLSLKMAGLLTIITTSTLLVRS